MAKTGYYSGGIYLQNASFHQGSPYALCHTDNKMFPTTATVKYLKQLPRESEVCILKVFNIGVALDLHDIVGIQWF